MNKYQSFEFHLILISSSDKSKEEEKSAKLSQFQQNNEELTKINEKLTKNYSEINKILTAEKEVASLYKGELKRYTVKSYLTGSGLAGFSVYPIKMLSPFRFPIL